jgi:ribulose-5-phosphate 4-epimerase/fuculose-1-phosphate aldolase
MAMMAVCDLDGEAAAVSQGPEPAPPSDTAAHAYAYRHSPDAGGAVRTHPNYAAARATGGGQVTCTHRR